MEREIKNAINLCQNNITECLLDADKLIFNLMKEINDLDYKKTGNLSRNYTGNIQMLQNKFSYNLTKLQDRVNNLFDYLPTKMRNEINNHIIDLLSKS